MKRKMIFGVVVFLFVLQAQMVFAADYNEDFRKELERNNLQNIERLLQRRANQMNLAVAMFDTINSSSISENNRLEVLKLLIRYGADVNRLVHVGSTAHGTLADAIRLKRSLAVIQFLLDSGSEAHYCLFLNQPIILIAYNNGDIAVVNLLLDRRGSFEGNELLPHLATRGDNNYIRQIIARGSVQIRSEQGAEALKCAAKNGKLDTVKLLVENGVNINARDKNGITSLSIAYDKGEMEIYNYLKANGAIDFEPKQVAQQPAAPAPSSSTTNVYVQPSTPAPSSSSSSSTPSRNVGKEIADAFKSPLQSGTYSLSGTQEKISIAGIAKSGIITQTWQGKSYQGTYNIDGNRMTVQIRGYTFVFNITSETSFSGHNETWVRTGF
jgi:ankyrin repeat protein